MSFNLSKKDIRKLTGVHPALVEVVHTAAALCPVDHVFVVFDGVRTLARQKEYVRRGVSDTLDSKHLPQADGFSHAVDLVPVGDHDGDPTTPDRVHWGMDEIYITAAAMAVAASRTRTFVVWGGVWDRLLTNLSSNGALSLKTAVRRYEKRRRSIGRSAFFDGAHFQLVAK